MSSSKVISDLVVSEENKKQDEGLAFSVRTASDLSPHLPPSTRPPPPWSRRARTPLVSLFEPRLHITLLIGGIL